MPSRVIHIDCSKILNNDTFHNEFRDKLGFPSFYGRNMNAWIDCLTYLDDGMTSINLNPGETLTLQLNEYKDLKDRCPNLAEAIIECSAFVNWRNIDAGEDPRLIISFD
tara:strand:+ start:1505 stop:1831 length:327 start_codon:yes stop_codon:yes gene_type:complete